MQQLLKTKVRCDWRSQSCSARLQSKNSCHNVKIDQVKRAKESMVRFLLIAWLEQFRAQVKGTQDDSSPNLLFIVNYYLPTFSLIRITLLRYYFFQLHKMSFSVNSRHWNYFLMILNHSVTLIKLWAWIFHQVFNGPSFVFCCIVTRISHELCPFYQILHFFDRDTSDQEQQGYAPYQYGMGLKDLWNLLNSYSKGERKLRISSMTAAGIFR